MKRKYSSQEILNMFHITSQTLYNWRRLGKIEFDKITSRTFVYYIDDESSNDKIDVLYCRVSNSKQRNDLIRQENLLRDFAVSNGIIISKVYSDIASGMNENRKGFTNLLNDIINYKIKRVYITYEDRLIRFGFDLLKHIFSIYDCEIIVVNATKHESYEEELTKDLISIIHHFSMKMYSNRRNKLKQIKKELES